MKKYNKYGNKKVTIDNINFDSKKEARRYQELKLMEKAGLITNLALQPKFLLQDKFEYGKKYNSTSYIADFSYIRVSDGCFVVEDVKGVKTDSFILKEKFFLKQMKEKGYIYGKEFEFNLI